jgi:hypothetical protein
MNPQSLGRSAEGALKALGALAHTAEAPRPPVTHTVIGATIEVESYADQILQSLIRNSDVMSSSFGRSLVSECEDSFYQSWKNRYLWLRKGFNISIAGKLEEQNFQTLVELRNAIIHGAGYLTDRQTRDIGKQVALERRLQTLLRVQVEGRKLEYLGSTDDLAVKIAREFVLLLDSEVRRVYPDLLI